MRLHSMSRFVPVRDEVVASRESTRGESVAFHVLVEIIKATKFLRTRWTIREPVRVSGMRLFLTLYDVDGAQRAQHGAMRRLQMFFKKADVSNDFPTS